MTLHCRTFPTPGSASRRACITVATAVLLAAILADRKLATARPDTG